jgi:hypothetical protein
MPEHENKARFFGGPLDGREEALSEEKAVAGAVRTHVFLHGGPKIETHYQLSVDDDGTWAYRVMTKVDEPGH